MTLPRAIPSPVHVEDERLRRILEAMAENLEVLGGIRGKVNDRALIVDDLLQIGIIGLKGIVIFDPKKLEAIQFAEQELRLTTGIAGTTDSGLHPNVTTADFTIGANFSFITSTFLDIQHTITVNGILEII